MKKLPPIENFKRATHQGPIYCQGTLKVKIEIESSEIGKFFVWLIRERPKRDNDNWEPHLVDHQMLHLKPLFHFKTQKRDNTEGI